MLIENLHSEIKVCHTVQYRTITLNACPLILLVFSVQSPSVSAVARAMAYTESCID